MNLLGIIFPTPEVQFTGWMVTAIGFCIVIITLIILFIVFAWISKVINKDWSKIFKKQNSDKIVKYSDDNPNEVDKNVAVAIAMALYLSKDVHDKEPDEITIERIQRRYSPWSAKHYGMNGNTIVR